jgi:hypothetical protein
VTSGASSAAIASLLAMRPEAHDVTVYLDLAPQKREPRRATLAALAGVGGGTGKVSRGGRKAATPATELSTVLASPWIIPSFDEDGMPDYSAAYSPLAALRLAGDASAACAALGSAAIIDHAVAAPMLAVVMHAESVLAQWRRSPHVNAMTGLLAAAHTAAADVTAGFVRTVAPASLTATIEALRTRVDGRPGIDRDWSDDLQARQLSWLRAATPQLDQREGPGRWKPLASMVLKEILPWEGPDQIDALALADLRRMLGESEASIDEIADRIDRDDWPALVAADEPPRAAAILVARAQHSTDWAADRGDLNREASLALAVRRLEVAAALGDAQIAKRFDDFAEVAATALDRGTPDLQLLVRMASLIGGTLRGLPDAAQQVASIVLGTDEPMVWRCVFDAASETLDGNRGLDQTAWQVLTVSLTRLRTLAQGEDTERLQMLWRSFARVVLGTFDGALLERGAASLVDAADLHGSRHAGLGASQIACNEFGDLHANLAVGAGSSADAAARESRALVLDPIRSEHGVWIDELHAPATGSAVIRRLGERRYGSGRLLELVSEGTPPVKADFHLWDADVSRAFGPTSTDEQRPVVAVRGEDGQWEPWRRGSEALAIELLRRGRRTRVTLVLNTMTATGLLMSTAPGESYLVKLGDFAREDAVGLEAALAEHADPVGLLVTIGLGDDGQLVLAPEPPAGTPHVELICPIDDRNLRWAAALDDLDDVVAIDTSHHARLAVPAPPPGFPGDITLRLAGNPQGGLIYAATYPFDARGQRTASVRAEAIWARALLGDPEALLEELWADQGEAVLDRSFGSLTAAGRVHCETAGAYVVEVWAESLTMKPVATETVPSEVVAGRTVEWRATVKPAHQLLVPKDTLTAAALSAVTTTTRPLRGIVWNRPRDLDRAVVVLEGAGRPELTVALGGVPANKGDRVTVAPLAEGDDVVRLELSAVYRTGSALWTIDAEAADGGAYVGSTSNGPSRDVVELAPGHVALVAPTDDLDLFSTHHGGAWVPPKGDVRRGTIERATTGEGLQPTRVKLRGGVVIGRTLRRVGRGPGELRWITIAVASRRGGAAALRRELDLVGRPVPPPDPKQPKKPPVDEGVDPAKLLQDLFEAGAPVSVSLPSVPPESAVIDELEQHGCSRREATLLLARDEVPALVSAAGYGQSGVAQLVSQLDGTIAVSFAATPDYDIDRLAAELGAEVDIALTKQSIYYVTRDEELHTFEFGWGKRLIAPADRLRYDGAPFDQIEQVLFHGDKVTEMTFVHDEDGNLVMDVHEATLAQAAGTRLYNQARNHSFVHLLHIKPHDGDVIVERIDGFNEGREGGNSAAFTGRRVAHAVVGAEDRAALIDEGVPDEGLTIYAQLDVLRFAETIGHELLYHRRRFTNTDQADLPAVIFVRGGTIAWNRSGSEMLLGLNSASSTRDDLPADLSVPRRGFSVDVNQLPRLERLEDASALEGALLMACVLPAIATNANPMLRAQLSNPKIPTRPTSSLQDLAGTEGLLLMVEESDASGVRLQYRQGISFWVPVEKLSAPPDRFAEKDVVRAVVDGGRIHLVTCSLSDRQFFGDGFRTLVALPTNPLQSDDAIAKGRDQAFWARMRKPMGFVPGGLPGEFAAPASRTRRNRRADGPAEYGWGQPNAEAFDALMRTPHPKIGNFGIDERGRLRIARAQGRVPWGRVTIEVTGQATAHVVDVAHAVDPSELTFADESSRAVASRSNGVRWRYHDSKTGTWVNDRADRHALTPASLASGPVFFWGDEGRLRYPTTHLQQFAFPSAFLTEGILHEGKPFPVAVAGIHMEGDVPDGLFLEVVPGVVCLVLAPLVRFRLSSRYGLGLGQVSLDSFGPGDVLVIQIAEDPTRAVDGIEILRWQRSKRIVTGRAALRANEKSIRLVAPVASFDEAAGSLEIGVGHLRIEVPTHRAPTSDVVTLTSANQVGRVGPSTALKAGDVILLGTENNQFVIHGMPDYTAWMANADKWGSDPWRSTLFETDRPHPERLRSAITALGGAVAATVNWADKDQQRVYFTFRRQMLRLAEGETALGTVVGHDGGRLLIQAGASLVRLHADAVVSGVPSNPREPAALEAVTRALIRAGTVIVLQGRPQGPAAMRLGGTPKDAVSVVAAAAVDEEAAAGLVVREVGTWALAWMPASELALADMTAADWDTIWLSTGRPLEAMQMRGDHSPALSLLAHRSVMAERARLQVGGTIDVELLAKAADDKRFFATTSNGTVLEMRAKIANEWEVGDQLTAVVEEQRRAWREVTVVPADERTVRLQLPRGRMGALLVADHLTPVEPPWGPQHGDESLQALWAMSANDATVLSADAVSRASEAARQIAPADEVDVASLALIGTVLLHHLLAADDDLLPLGLLEADQLQDSRKQWSDHVDRVLVSLGRRALRSLHVEALERSWIRVRSGQRGVPWLRLAGLAGALGQPQRSAALRQLGSVIEHLELAGGIEGRRTAAALRVATGDSTASLTILEDGDLRLPEVVRLTRLGNQGLQARPATVSRANRERQRDGLLMLFQSLRADGDATVLLAEPPWFHST